MSEEAKADTEAIAPICGAASSMTGEHRLSPEMIAYIDELGISRADGVVLDQMAEEAAARFESEAEGVAWLDREVRRKHPKLWWSIRKRASRRLR
jgi:hypothetical protein